MSGFLVDFIDLISLGFVAYKIKFGGFCPLNDMDR